MAISLTPDLYEIRTELGETTSTVYGLHQSNKIVAEYIDPDYIVSGVANNPAEAYRFLTSTPYNIYDWRNYQTKPNIIHIGKNSKHESTNNVIASFANDFNNDDTILHYVDSVTGMPVYLATLQHRLRFNTNHGTSDTSSYGYRISDFLPLYYNSNSIIIHYVILREKYSLLDNEVLVYKGYIIYNLDTKSITLSNLSTGKEIYDPVYTAARYINAFIDSITINGTQSFYFFVHSETSINRNLYSSYIYYNGNWTGQISISNGLSDILYSRSYVSSDDAIMSINGVIINLTINSTLGTFDGIFTLDSTYTQNIFSYSYENSSFYYVVITNGTSIKQYSISKATGNVSLIGTSVIYDSSNRTIQNILSDFSGNIYYVVEYGFLYLLTSPTSSWSTDSNKKADTNVNNNSLPGRNILKYSTKVTIPLVSDEGFANADRRIPLNDNEEIVYGSISDIIIN